MTISTRVREESGFGLVELLIAMTVMVVGITALVAGMSSGFVARQARRGRVHRGRGRRQADGGVPRSSEIRCDLTSTCTLRRGASATDVLQRTQHRSTGAATARRVYRVAARDSAARLRQSARSTARTVAPTSTRTSSTRRRPAAASAREARHDRRVHDPSTQSLLRETRLCSADGCSTFDQATG